ncbi:hypothetical protein MCP_2024 [Methanocella paludicola SANAE]|uniref:Uncharacterized protein n=1 Tax=Methanocella paludicola (strain DSM 17711 / JCM 13418 / NBRC 101707 / SANAE) TaxID=304371 RepID=D1Z074_METPS|nr:MTH865 family protein [Methanocella paludicola]BAI62096.1 hypothetical protein MCP_2024 [Methanocella paludicola SANAE]
MSEKEPVYSTYGDSPRYSQATEERILERVKSEAQEALSSMDIQFPVNNKHELLSAIAVDRPTHCHYYGRTLTLKELAGSLRDDDFPLRDAAQAAIAIAGACPMPSGSPEGAPDTRPV